MGLGTGSSRPFIATSRLLAVMPAVKGYNNTITISLNSYLFKRKL